jgi:hypothetical protein
MKKKILVLALLLTLFTVFSASAYTAAVGAEFSFSALGSGGLPGSSVFLTFRLPKFPMVFGVGGYLGSGSGSYLAVMADWWFAQGNLVNFLNYYVGVGGYLDVSSTLYAGLRIPFGINAFPIKPLELFLELAPAFGVINSSSIGINWAGLQTGLGFRFWF